MRREPEMTLRLMASTNLIGSHFGATRTGRSGDGNGFGLGKAGVRGCGRGRCEGGERIWAGGS